MPYLRVKHVCRSGKNELSHDVLATQPSWFCFVVQQRSASTNIVMQEIPNTVWCHSHIWSHILWINQDNAFVVFVVVFKCAYAHLVQPWYTAPELGDSQPLHRALQEEFNLVVEKIICKAKNFDLSATSVGCVRILTQHLHNAKQSDRWACLFSLSSQPTSSKYDILHNASDLLFQDLFLC